jgi:hypothetical protein
MHLSQTTTLFRQPRCSRAITYRVPEIDFNGAHPRLTTDQRASAAVRIKDHNYTRCNHFHSRAICCRCRATYECHVHPTLGLFPDTPCGQRRRRQIAHMGAQKGNRVGCPCRFPRSFGSQPRCWEGVIGKRLPIGDSQQNQLGRAPEDANHLRHRTLSKLYAHTGTRYTLAQHSPCSLSLDGCL